MGSKLNVWKAYAKELGVLAFLGYLWQRFILRKKIIKGAVQGLREPVYIRNQPADHALFTQLFVQKEYGVAISTPVKRIIDCGANIGLACLYFLRQYPHATITCIEPDAANFLMLQMNTRTAPNVTCLRKAVWNKQESLTIYGQSRGAAGLMVRKADTAIETTVEGVSLDLLIKENEVIDILKIDIEGSEKEVLLMGNTSWLQRVNRMLVEIHDDIHPGLTADIINKLFSCFVIRRQGEYHVFEKIDAA